MKKWLAAGIAVLGLALATSDADAAARGGGFRGGGFRGGVFVGGVGFYDPLWWPWYDPWYYPYLPPEVIIRYAPPPGYLPPPEGAAASQYWYRCGNPEGYYPYVRQCSTGWEQVPVTPQGAPPAPLPPR